MLNNKRKILVALILACSVIFVGYKISNAAIINPCLDTVDNDNDGFTDMNDPGCRHGNKEEDHPECFDKRDNDGGLDRGTLIGGRGAIDYPDDPGCSSIFDDTESTHPQCSDTKDNDNNGYTDFISGDPGCISERDNTEAGSILSPSHLVPDPECYLNFSNSACADTNGDAIEQLRKSTYCVNGTDAEHAPATSGDCSSPCYRGAPWGIGEYKCMLDFIIAGVPTCVPIPAFTQVCSIADKYNGVTTVNSIGDESRLSSGVCKFIRGAPQCLAGLKYKICCAIPAYLRDKESVNSSQVVGVVKDATNTEHKAKDSFPPDEGWCAATFNSTPITTVKAPEGVPPVCPQPPTIQLQAVRLTDDPNTTENESTKAKITWNATGTTSMGKIKCEGVNFSTGLTGDIPSNQGEVITTSIPTDNKFAIKCVNEFIYVKPGTTYYSYDGQVWNYASATVGGTAFYYCPSSGGTCATAGTYMTEGECKVDVKSTCYADSACDGKCAPPVGDSQYYFCQTDRPTPVCGQASGTYSTEKKCEDALEKWWKGRTPEPFACYIKKGDCDIACSSPCPASCTSGRCPRKVCQNQSCVNVNTCGTDECPTLGAQCGGPEPCPEPPVETCELTDANISLSLKSSPQCLPAQPGGSKDTILTWSANIDNPCDIIGGGTTNPASLKLYCETTTPSWQFCAQGTSFNNKTYTINDLDETTAYGLKCSRGAYTCTNSKSGYEEFTDCDNKWCKTCVACVDCTCNDYCAEYYKDDAHCLDWKQCSYPAICTRTIPCGINGKNPDGSPCTTTEQYTCYEDDDCIPKSCLEYACEDTDWEGTRTSKKVCAYIAPTKEEIVRVVQKPYNLSLKAKPEGAGDYKFSFDLAKIILTKFAEFELGARADSSSSATYSFTTEMFCKLGRKIADTSNSFATLKTTGRVRGSGSLTIQNPTLPFTDNAFYSDPQYREQPYKASQYELYCKNQSGISGEATSCYDENQTRGDLRVEPYGTKVKEE